MYSSWDMVRDGQTDRRMDGQKKWHIEVGGPPKIVGKKFLNLHIKNRIFQHQHWDRWKQASLTGRPTTLE